jgi:hypothetical protein
MAVAAWIAIALAAVGAGASTPAPHDVAVGDELGGCGWSRCVNCVGGPCTPENQKCIGKVPKYTFHLADPTCDINDPSNLAKALAAACFLPNLTCCCLACCARWAVL